MKKLFFGVLLLSLPLHAAPGDLDSAFVAGIGVGITPESYPTFDSGTSAVNAVALQSDGKILAGGNVSKYNNTGALNALKRINPDGSLDTTFNSSGAGLVDSQGQPEVNSIVVLGDDSILIGGSFTSYNGVARNGILKLNADGSLDETFAPSGLGSAARTVVKITVQPDGKIFISGGFTVVNGTYRKNIARLESNGDLDTTFASNSLSLTRISDVKLAADGKIYVSGSATGTSDTGLYRLYQDGTLDSSFIAALGAGSSIDAILLLPSGTILAGGFTNLEDAGYNRALAALTPNGQIDTTFMANMGSGPDGYAGYELLEAPDGKILVASRFLRFDGQFRPAIARLQADGTPDLSFAPAPYTTANDFLTHFYCAAYQPDGKIVAGGWFDRVTDPNLETFNLTRFEGDPVSGPGSIRWTATTTESAEGNSITLTAIRFGGLTGAVSANYTSANGTATAGSDYTAAAGTFSWAAGEGGSKSVVISTLQDTADEGNETFTIALSSPTGGATIAPGQGTSTVTILDDDSDPVFTLQPQSTTQIASLSVTFSGAASHALPITYEWFNEGGSLVGLQPSLTLTNVQPSSSGSYFLRATITDPQTGLPRSVDSDPVTLTVVEPPGSPDLTWSPGTGFNSNVSSIHHLSDGSMLVGGLFSQYSGTAVNQLVKLSASGVLDTGWPATGTGPNGDVRDIFPTGNGKFLLAGAFSTYNGVNQRGIARINADGTLDTGFVRTTSGTARAVRSLPDGSILAGFDNIGLRKFNATGTELASFQPFGSSTTIYDIEVQPDGKILVAAQRISGARAGTVYRLNSDLTIDPGFNTAIADSFNAYLYQIALAPSGHIYMGGSFSAVNGTGRSNLARLNPDGTLDTSYIPLIGGQIQSIVLQEDGRLLLGGFFFTIDSTNVSRLGRLLPDGRRDTGFFTNNGANSTIYAISRSPLGEIYIGGAFSTFYSVAAGRIARMNGDFGSIQFDTNALTINEQDGTATLRVKRLSGNRGAASVQYQLAGGNAVAGVDFTGTTSGTLTWADGDTSERDLIFNIINNGTPDGTRTLELELFNPTYPVELGAFATTTLTILDDESLATVVTAPQPVTVPEANSATFSVEVISATTVSYQWLKAGAEIPGETSADYTIPAVALSDAADYSVRITNAAGNFVSPAAALTVLISPTAVDASWSPSGPGAATLNGLVRAILPLPDGGALVGGDFTLPQRGIVRLDASGALVPSFTLALDSTAGGTGVHDLMMDGEGRVYVAGRWDSIGGKTQGNLIRLKPDFSFDDDFAAALGTGPDGLVRDVSPDASAGILIGGAFQRVADLPGTSGFARISENGIIDRTLVARAYGEIYRIAQAPGTDKIYIGGAITNYFSRGYLLRLNADGSRDTLFNATTVVGVVRDFIFRPDGGLVVGGAFSNGRAYFTAITPTGAEDPYLAASLSVGGPVNSLAPQSNGKIAVGGAFTTFSGSANRFGRITADGKPDATINLGTGFSGEVFKIAASPNGRLWVGGNFTQFKGASSNYLTRLHGDDVETGILVQPLPQEVVAGNSATFSVTATGTGTPDYQWFKDGVLLSNGGNISGATSSTLQVSNAQTADEAIYSARVYTGTTEALSQGVSLRIVAAYEVDSITTGGEFPVGKRFVLTASGAGAGALSYQWKQGANDVPSAISPTLVIANPSTANSGSYTLEITNSFGTTVSPAVNLTFVDPAPAAIRHIPLTSAGGSGSMIRPLPDGRFFLDYGSNYGTNSLRLYDTAGIQSTIPSFNGRVSDIFRQENGGYLVAGTFTQVGGQAAKFLARLKPDLTLDSTFQTNLGSFTGSGAQRVIELPDGRIVVAGILSNLNGEAGTTGLVILRRDGLRDSSFTSKLQTSFASFYGLAFDPTDSTLIFAGSDMTYSGVTSPIHRIRLDGSRTPTFNVTVVGSIQSLILQPDQKILIGGSFANVQGAERIAIARLNPDGTLDSSFVASSGLKSTNGNGSVKSMALETDGDIVVVGEFPIFNGIGQNSIIRLRPDGSTDSRFHPGFGFTGNGNRAESVAVAADGSILATGSFQNYNDIIVNEFVILEGDRVPLAFAAQPGTQEAIVGETVTLTATGTGTSAVTYQWFKGSNPLSDVGDISGSTTGTLTITNADPSDSGLYRVEITNLSGTLSASANVGVFETPEILEQPSGGTFFVGNSATFYSRSLGAGTLSYAWFKGSNQLSDGPNISGADSPILTLSNLQKSDSGNYHLVVSSTFGSDTSTDAVVSVLLEPGAFSSGFPATAGANNQIRVVLPLDNGGALIGGSFTAAGPTGSETAVSNAALLGPDGVVDSSFSPQPNGVVYAIARDQSDGILVGGQFTQIGGQNLSNLARFTSAGAYDTAFNANLGTGSNGTVYKFITQPDGKVLVAGGYQTIAGESRRGLARLNADGTLDSSFNPSLSSFASVLDMDLAANGKIIITGSFSISGRQNIARLNSDGTLDTTFDCALNFQAQAIAAQDDGKIVVGGFFNNVNGQATGSLVRLNSNGTVDTSFAANPSFPSTVNTIAIQSNGRILVGGSFFEYAGSSRYMLRLLPDGTVDPGFDLGTSWNFGQTYHIALATSGSIWAGGLGTSFNGQTVNRLVVLNGDEPTSPPVDPFATFTAGLPAGQQGVNDDPDGDGIPNLVEFALGTDPAVFNTNANGLGTEVSGSTLGLDPAKTYKVITVEVPKDTRGTAVDLEASADLSFAGDANTTEILPRTDNGTTETRSYYLTPAIEDAPEMFWRMSATR